jgi:hypothetical protein
VRVGLATRDARTRLMTEAQRERVRLAVMERALDGISED